MTLQRQVFQRYLTDAEERQLLRALSQYADVLARRDHAWVRWLRHTGIRVAAASRFTCAEAREAIASGHQVVQGEKLGKTTSVYLTKKARQALRDLLRVRREQGFSEDPEAPLVVSRRGKGLSVRSYQARMRYWCGHAGLRVEASPHWLRHTLAKRIMKRSTAEDPRGVVMAALNHSTIHSTSVYTMPDREQVQQALDESQ